LDGLDETGHEYTWGSQEYEYEIGLLDFYLGKILDALKSKGVFEETYILITSDHGGRFGQDFHGEQKDSNIFVPWILVGPNIKKNYEIIGNLHNMDSMPTLMEALGYQPHYLWRGSSMHEVFEGYQEVDFLD
jgi:arylsulfatase A-like enzyme